MEQHPPSLAQTSRRPSPDLQRWPGELEPASKAACFLTYVYCILRWLVRKGAVVNTLPSYGFGYLHTVRASDVFNTNPEKGILFEYDVVPGDEK